MKAANNKDTEYAGWSAPLLFAYGINRFFHDKAQMIKQTKWPASAQSDQSLRCDLYG